MNLQVIADPKNKQVLIHLKLADKNAKDNIRKALITIGAEHVRHARGLMLKKKTGRIYNINGKKHQASAPGEAPAILSGDLKNSVGKNTRGHTEMEFGDKDMEGKAPYGKFLEEGVKYLLSGHLIKPRPHIGVTVKSQFRNTKISLEEAMAKSLKI